MSKPCRKCGGTDRNNGGACRPCAKEYRRKYYRENKEKLLAQNREWVKANPEKSKAYYRAYRERNLDKRNADSRKWNQDNLDRRKENGRKHYQKNKDRISETHRKHHQNNKEAATARGLKRKARMNGNGGKLSASDIKALYAAYPKCLACGATENLSLDHVVPIARGGLNSIENIQVLCRSCNSSKRTKTTDFRPFILRPDYKQIEIW